MTRAKNGATAKVARMKQDKATEDAQLLTEILAAFTKYPKHTRIEIERRDEDNSILLNITAHGADQPMIIGKMGRHLQAIRTIFLCIGKREGRGIVIMANEPKVGAREEIKPAVADPHWTPANMIALLKKILNRILREPFDVTSVANAEQILLEIHADKKEQETAEGLKPYLHTLFHAMGSRDGQNVYVNAAASIPVVT